MYGTSEIDDLWIRNAIIIYYGLDLVNDILQGTRPGLDFEASLSKINLAKHMCTANKAYLILTLLQRLLRRQNTSRMEDSEESRDL